MNKRANNYIDHSGEIINSWTIISYSHTDSQRKPNYLCRCVCGKEKISQIRTILNGKTKSCGCQNVLNHVVHGASRHPMYKRLNNIKNRCYNENNAKYKWYGGRGINVSQEWLNDPLQFIKDMGNPPTDKHSIDRINNELGYSKENCRWATMKEQCNNRRKYIKPTTT